MMSGTWHASSSAIGVARLEVPSRGDLDTGLIAEGCDRSPQPTGRLARPDGAKEVQMETDPSQPVDPIPQPDEGADGAGTVTEGGGSADGDDDDATG